MATKTELVCSQQFAANGKEYGVGQVVPQEDYMAWPDASLPNRLANGFVKYETVEVVEEAPKSRKPKEEAPAAE